MSDLFHEDVPSEFIDMVFARMNHSRATKHKFIILTKRPARMKEYISSYSFRDGWFYRTSGAYGFSSWPLPNVWLGVSVEGQRTADDRIPVLLHTPAAIRFVSYEPALGPVDLFSHPGETEPHSPYPHKIDWVICGAESGHGARPMDPDWARSVRNQCQSAGVPFFLKQIVVEGKLVKEPFLDDRQWLEFPKSGGNDANR